MDWKYFNWRQMEFHGKLNMLKTGLVFADSLNTVSPRYAARDTDPDRSASAWRACCSIAGRRLLGITNGIDTEIWDPATDPYLPVNYGAQTLRRGQGSGEGRLCKKTGPDPSGPDVPLVGFSAALIRPEGLRPAGRSDLSTVC